MRFKPGETLFKEGDEPEGIYILEAGQADLLFSARNGHVKPLRVVQSGQILGLSAVVGNKPHDCTAIARTGCRVGFIDRQSLRRLLDENPSTWFDVLRLLSNDVNAAYDDMRSLVNR